MLSTGHYIRTLEILPEVPASKFNSICFELNIFPKASNPIYQVFWTLEKFEGYFVSSYQGLQIYFPEDFSGSINVNFASRFYSNEHLY